VHTVALTMLIHSRPLGHRLDSYWIRIQGLTRGDQRAMWEAQQVTRHEEINVRFTFFLEIRSLAEYCSGRGLGLGEMGGLPIAILGVRGHKRSVGRLVKSCLPSMH
jgi:hypothetical protein